MYRQNKSKHFLLTMLYSRLHVLNRIATQQNAEYKEIWKSSDALSDHWRPHNDAISVDKDPNTVRAIVHSHDRVLWQDLHVVNACTRAENDLLRLLPRLPHKLRPRLGPLRTHVSLSLSKCSWSCAAQP